MKLSSHSPHRFAPPRSVRLDRAGPPASRERKHPAPAPQPPALPLGGPTLHPAPVHRHRLSNLPGPAWRSYQLVADRRLGKTGLFLLLWRRQSGKTEVLSTWALQSLLALPGQTVVLASASLNVGGEVALRAAAVFWRALTRLRRRFPALEAVSCDPTPGSRPSPVRSARSVAAAFVAGRLEVRFVHTHGPVSRLKVIAPNPATARGFSGTVFLDEVGFIPAFRDVWEAIEPITASDPSFRLVMSTTPPADTAHLAHELIVPPTGQDFDFTVPSGVWYRSSAGILVHRVDAWDAATAGAALFDPESRGRLAVSHHRFVSLDRESWNRNYGLHFALAGTAALSLTALHHAQHRPESVRCLAFENRLPSDWRTRLGELREPVTLGFDVATTEHATSNPSALAVVERLPSGHAVRLLFRWKTDDPRVSAAYLRDFVTTLRIRRLCIDATNEKFFARSLRDELGRHCPVELVVASEKIAVGGESYLLKSYLGHLVVSALEDARLVLPPDRWVNLDFRLVRRDCGGFAAEVDGSGHHADTFDATKLALHGWLTAPAGAYTAETLAQVRVAPAPAPLSRPLLSPPPSYSFS